MHQMEIFWLQYTSSQKIHGQLSHAMADMIHPIPVNRHGYAGRCPQSPIRWPGSRIDITLQGCWHRCSPVLLQRRHDVRADQGQRPRCRWRTTAENQSVKLLARRPVKSVNPFTISNLHYFALAFQVSFGLPSANLYRRRKLL